jgi:hypothetical protein
MTWHRVIGAVVGVGAALVVGIAIAGTDLHSGDVAVIGAANASPGVSVAQGGNANVTIEVTANDGNIAAGQVEEGYVTLVTKYVVSSTGTFSADNATTSTQSFNAQNFSQAPQTLSFVATVEVAADAPCDEYSTQAVIADKGNQINYAAGFSSPLIYVTVTGCTNDLLFSGPLAPYDANKSYKAGSTLPLKWQYTDDGSVVDSSGLAPVVKIAGPFQCAANGETYETAETPGASGLTYDPNTDTWHYNWKTPKQAGCYWVQISAGGAETGVITVNLK